MAANNQNTNSHPFTGSEAEQDLTINYMHTKLCPGPILGIATRFGWANMLVRTCSFVDPAFNANPIFFQPPYTHASRMAQMKSVVERATAAINRPRAYEQYNTTLIAQSSATWADGIPLVLFACSFGDRTRYPSLRELDEKKADLARIEKELQGLANVNGGDFTAEKKRTLATKIGKLKDEVAILEEGAEGAAAVKWGQCSCNVDIHTKLVL
ncbi:hypothetical protein V8F20_006598 [Naviculisporaceae sp. PSN 640]